MAQRYVTMDSTGRATGFYLDVLHRIIPQGALKITDDLYLEWMASPTTRAWQNGALVTVPAVSAAATTSAAAAT